MFYYVVRNLKKLMKIKNNYISQQQSIIQAIKMSVTFANVDSFTTPPKTKVTVVPDAPMHHNTRQSLTYLSALTRNMTRNINECSPPDDYSRPIDPCTKEARKRRDMAMFCENVSGEYNSDWTNNLYISNPDPRSTPLDIANTFESMFECKVRSVDYIGEKTSDGVKRIQRKYNIAYSFDQIGEPDTDPSTYTPIPKSNAFVNMLYWEVDKIPKQMYHKLVTGQTVFIPYNEPHLKGALMRVKMAIRKDKTEEVVSV